MTPPSNEALAADAPAADHRRFELALTLGEGYAFTVDFGPGIPALDTDEPPPLGAGAGPNPARLLGAAIGSCLGASLLFCLRKARVEVAGLRVNVDGELVRNEANRLRVGGVRVRLEPSLAGEPQPPERLARCLELFESFCIVTESVRQGIDVSVAVEPQVEATGAAPTRLANGPSGRERQ
jgi:uncharacterized OsmC-like protein